MKNIMDDTNSRLYTVETKTYELDISIETTPNEMQRKK